jgi:YesN/AraC family two-component response regulator
MGKPKILIIDDEPSLLALFADYLGKDYDVLTAKSEAEGKSVFDANNVSLVLLDLKLRDTSGIEVLRRIRAKSSNVPVIVMTGYSSHETAIKCADLGVQGYMLKPSKLDDLKRRIDNCLGVDNNGAAAAFVDKALEERLKAAGLIVKGALKVIQGRFRDQALSRNLIAEAVGVSDDYLSKQFHQECGVSIPEYINRLRVNEAAKLLAATNTKVSEIAFSLGFSSPSYFSAIFKKHFDTTPEQYRRGKRL